MRRNFKMMKNPLFLLMGLVALWSCEGDLTDMGSPSMDFAGGMRSDAGGNHAGSGNGEVNLEPGQITAGEWKDLDNWTFWGNLMNKQEFDKLRTYWGFHLSNRVSVQLSGQNGQALVDVPITLKRGNAIIWQARTDNLGRAELWSDTFGPENLRIENDPLVLDIHAGGMQYSPVRTFFEGINAITYSGNAAASPQKAEIALVVDATGSMGDELEYLKVELKDVIQRVRNQHAQVPLFTGSVFYRDEGDDYLTRESPFTSDINKTMGFIQNQSAEGGGDYPEAVHTAMEKAIHSLQWSSNAKARLLFLVLDAPPHHRPEVIKSLQNSIKSAAAKGIKVIPVTASGIDKETEFLMRFFSIATNGTYVFITNHSGIGNDHLEPTVGDYEVEFLNDLMVRLINEALQ